MFFSEIGKVFSAIDSLFEAKNKTTRRFVIQYFIRCDEDMTDVGLLDETL